MAKPENLRFFPDPVAALRAGFRPCKRCQPTRGEPGLDNLVKVARHIEEHAGEKLTLADLAEVGALSASRLQRKFKQLFGMSPRAYQDALRMKRLKSGLKEGADVTSAIYDAGFGSASRVYGDQARNIGMTPGAYRAGGAGETISHAFRQTALGPLMMAATGRGVCFVQFGDDEAGLLQQLRNEFPKAELKPSGARYSPDLDDWIEALEHHLGKKAPRPDLPLDLRGTAFQVMVWRFLLGLDEGEVISYAELAGAIGKPRAVRAAASACAANRIGVLVPCHRVLRSDGGAGGYRWGLERKRALLDMERSQSVKS